MTMTETTTQKIEIPSKIVVKDLAEKMDKPVTDVISNLMQNGVMSTLNEWIDFDTAAIVAEDMGFEVIQVDEEDGSAKEAEKLIQSESKEGQTSRPPVVVVMGHVDHGKTKLLDAVRETNVVDGEAGGITQHIGAYQIEEKGRLITFIDTPGHEAFTAMRSRGARVADIAILIVAANDGVKPQTVEAIEIIKKSQLPMIVAINKIDLPDANPDKTKQQLAEKDVLVEDWGGKIPVIEISAKQKTNIRELLDLLLLVADVNKKQIVADPTREAVGTVIESNIDKGRGPVATVVIQTGTLHAGDLITVGGVVGGKVKIMRDHLGKEIKKAVPSQPSEIIGLKRAAKVGDILTVIDKKELNKIRKQKDYKPTTPTVHIKKKDVEAQSKDNKAPTVKQLNVVIKADVLGSLEAIIESLEKIKGEDVSVKVVAKGLGNVTEADVLRATTAQAKLYAFNVAITPHAQEVAKGQEFTIQPFQVIYDLINDVVAGLEELMSPEIIKTELGVLNVLAVFRTKLPLVIAGGKVTKGKLLPDSKVEIVRQKEVIGQALITQLQIDKQAVSEVTSGRECGLKLKSDLAIEVGDRFNVYREETKQKKLIIQ